jgi:hypothetical protein
VKLFHAKAQREEYLPRSGYSLAGAAAIAPFLEYGAWRPEQSSSRLRVFA